MMFMREGTGMYTVEIKKEMCKNDPMGNGIHPPAQVISSKSAGKASPGSREHNGTINIIPTATIHRVVEVREPGLPVQDLPVAGQEGVEEDKKFI